jgi:anti-sigma regulatory factor (Ser/Thr protein kinase)
LSSQTLAIALADPCEPGAAMTSWGTGGVLLMEYFGVTDLKRLRSACYASVLEAGLDNGRAIAFVFAINEGLTNAVLHGGGMGQLILLRNETDRLIANVVDPGGATARLTEDLPPSTFSVGRGLWAARRMVDDLTLITSVEGTSLRLEVAIAQPANLLWMETGAHAELVPLLASILFEDTSEPAAELKPQRTTLALVNGELGDLGSR